jgi:hypothetical protein
MGREEIATQNVGEAGDILLSVRHFSLQAILISIIRSII